LTAEDSALLIFGETTTTLTTPEASVFEGYDMKPAPVFGNTTGNVSMWLCPDKADWTYKDLGNLRTNFTKEEKIAVCLQVETVAASEDTVELLYLLRNEEGHVVMDESGEFTWNSLWYERRHCNEIPLPIKEGESVSTPGKYTLEIYINGGLLVQRDFNIA
jgi:hypothetical protein